VIIHGLKIHPELLDMVEAERCLLHECFGACCSGGVWLDVEDLKEIVPHVEAIKANLPEERRDPNTWFSTPEPDEDRPSGAKVGTNVVDDPVRPGMTCCVFLRPDRLCALQVTSGQLGLGSPGLKPFFCALYPISVEHGEVIIDHDTEDAFPGANCRRFCTAAKPAYEMFRQELTLILGEDGYHELQAKAATSTAEP
jgi:hypothetical protein